MKLTEWVEHYRLAGHDPRAAPTRENPERWDCGYIWYILTLEQTGQKFAHLGEIARKRRLGIPLPWEKDPVWAEEVRKAEAKNAHERAQFKANEHNISGRCPTCQDGHPPGQEWRA